jgi:hypothetical protein
LILDFFTLYRINFLDTTAQGVFMKKTVFFISLLGIYQTITAQIGALETQQHIPMQQLPMDVQQQLQASAVQQSIPIQQQAVVQQMPTNQKHIPIQQLPIAVQEQLQTSAAQQSIPVQNQTVVQQMPMMQQQLPVQQNMPMTQHRISNQQMPPMIQQLPMAQPMNNKRIPFIHEVPNARRVPITDQNAFMRQMPTANQQPREITDKAIDQFYNARFQRELKYLESEYRKIKPVLDNFKNQLIAFSKQPLAYQKNYNNIVSVINSFEAIRQKQFAISLTKLLQFKTLTNDAQVAHVSKMVDALEKNITEIEQNLKTFAEKPEWKSNQFTNSQKVDSQKSLYDLFEERILSPFPFKVKKVKRSIDNWKNV